jgi:hypothetical protein
MAAAGTIREWSGDEGFGVIDAAESLEVAGRTSP